jgi:hypothetical protein
LYPCFGCWENQKVEYNFGNKEFLFDFSLITKEFAIEKKNNSFLIGKYYKEQFNEIESLLINLIHSQNVQNPQNLENLEFQYDDDEYSNDEYESIDYDDNEINSINNDDQNEIYFIDEEINEPNDDEINDEEYISIEEEEISE